MESIGVFDEELGRKKDMLLSNEELGLIQEIGTHKSVYYLPKAMIFHHVMAYRLNKSYYSALTKIRPKYSIFSVNTKN